MKELNCVPAVNALEQRSDRVIYRDHAPGLLLHPANEHGPGPKSLSTEREKVGEDEDSLRQWGAYLGRYPLKVRIIIPASWAPQIDCMASHACPAVEKTFPLREGEELEETNGPGGSVQLKLTKPCKALLAEKISLVTCS